MKALVGILWVALGVLLLGASYVAMSPRLAWFTYRPLNIAAGLGFLIAGILVTRIGFSPFGGTTIAPGVITAAVVWLGMFSVQSFISLQHRHQEYLDRAQQQVDETARLKQSGVKVAATITNVESCSVVTYHRCARFIDLEWTDPATGKTYNFRSGRMFQDPTFKLRSLKTLDVYLDPNNYAKYYVDLSAIGL
jgi:hypothetical protein